MHHYLCYSCCCVLAVLSSLSSAFEQTTGLTVVGEPNTTVNASVLTRKVHFYVGVVQSITLSGGNYNYSEMRKIGKIADVLRDLNFTFDVLQRVGQCNGYESARNFVDIYVEYIYLLNTTKNLGVSRWKAVFLSDCEQACQLIGRLGSNIASEGIPVISHGCGSPEFSNPVQYRTFARVSGMFSYLADPMASLFVHFKVSRVVIVSSLDMAMEATRAAFSETFERSKIKTFEYQLHTASLSPYDDSEQTVTMFTEAAEFIYKNARCS